ncbi:MAG: glucokinase [Nitrospinota bacterium]|nr:glucokinase [Nitrospinota bacterium]
MILTGDVGGTKVNLALFEVHRGALSLKAEQSFASRDFDGLLDLLQHFLKETQPNLTHACLGVAGPVHEGRCEVTNLPWSIEVRDLKALLGIESVSLINDLAAMACAIPHLRGEEVAVIQKGQGDPQGTIGVLAAGTGLGQAFLVPEREGRWRVLETEGGQCDFAARTSLEISLREFLGQVFGRVCIEDVLSGPGLVRIFEFIKERDGITEPDWLTREFEQIAPAEVISRNGLSGKFPSCEEALQMFVSVYGAVAGNLALQIVARGGIWIGGGIAPEILPLLKSDLFLEAFRDKGKFSDFMAQIDIKVIMNKRAPLFGAGYFALGETVIR